MDLLLRRRMMMAQGIGAVSPVYYSYLVGDGVAYVDTGYTLPENASMAAMLGHETRKASQCMFAAGYEASGTTGIIMGGGTNTSSRQFVAFYDSTAYNGYTNLSFSYSEYGMWITPNRFGYGGVSKTFTKGSARPQYNLFVFAGINSGSSSYPPFTGALVGDFCVYGPDAASVTNFDGFASFTPIATFRPCTYNGEAGLWYVEENRFCGNAAGSGSLIATNSL